MHNPPRPGSPPPRRGPYDGQNRGPGQGGGGGRPRSSEDDYRRRIEGAFGTQDYVALILNPQRGDYNDYLKKVKRFVEGRAKQITRSQLGNVFSRVRKAKSAQDLHRLRPQLAYVAGRSDKEEMRELVVLLDDLIQKVTDETLKEFRSFFEAVIAYHRYFNPKEG